MLKKKEIDLVHERMKDVSLPLSFTGDRMTNILGKKHKSITKIIFFSAFSRYAFRGLLNKDHRRMFHLISEGMKGLLKHVVYDDDLEKYHEMLVEGLSLRQGLYPRSEWLHPEHYALHLKSYIKKYGPIVGFWMCPAERNLHIVNTVHFNPNHPLASMARNVDALYMAVTDSFHVGTENTAEFLDFAKRKSNSKRLSMYEIQNEDVSGIEIRRAEVELEGATRDYFMGWDQVDDLLRCHLISLEAGEDLCQKTISDAQAVEQRYWKDARCHVERWSEARALREGYKKAKKKYGGTDICYCSLCSCNFPYYKRKVIPNQKPDEACTIRGTNSRYLSLMHYLKKCISDEEKKNPVLKGYLEFDNKTIKIHQRATIKGLRYRSYDWENGNGRNRSKYLPAQDGLGYEKKIAYQAIRKILDKPHIKRGYIIKACFPKDDETGNGNGKKWSNWYGVVKYFFWYRFSCDVEDNCYAAIEWLNTKKGVEDLMDDEGNIYVDLSNSGARTGYVSQDSYEIIPLSSICKTGVAVAPDDDHNDSQRRLNALTGRAFMIDTHITSFLGGPYESHYC